MLAPVMHRWCTAFVAVASNTNAAQRSPYNVMGFQDTRGSDVAAVTTATG